jgi:hypothetical protein
MFRITLGPARALLFQAAKDDAIMALRERIEWLLMEFHPMSPEEIERTVQFLLQQQAQFVGDFQKLTGKTDRLADGLIGLTGIMGQLLTAQHRTGEQLQETARHLQETDHHLSKHISTVESHLNVVIEMFERHLREDHGHDPS